MTQARPPACLRRGPGARSDSPTLMASGDSSRWEASPSSTSSCRPRSKLARGRGVSTPHDAHDFSNEQLQPSAALEDDELSRQFRSWLWQRTAHVHTALMLAICVAYGGFTVSKATLSADNILLCVGLLSMLLTRVIKNPPTVFGLDALTCGALWWFIVVCCVPLLPMLTHAVAPEQCREQFRDFLQIQVLAAIGYFAGGLFHGSQPVLLNTKIRWFALYVVLYTMAWTQTFLITNDSAALKIGWPSSCIMFGMGFGAMQLIETTVIWPLWIGSARHKIAMGELERMRRDHLLAMATGSGHGGVDDDDDDDRDHSSRESSCASEKTGSSAYWQRWYVERDEERLEALEAEREAERLVQREREHAEAFLSMDG